MGCGSSTQIEHLSQESLQHEKTPIADDWSVTDEVLRNKDKTNKNKTTHITEDSFVADQVLKNTNENAANLEQKENTNTDDLSFTFEDLKNIDDHALNTPTSAEESIDTLAAYLAKPAKNEIEVIRALYVWVCNNISYDVESFFGGEIQSATTDTANVFRSKRSVCDGYANIFQALCGSCQIKCKKISGYAKGFGYVLGTKLSYNQKINHAWNVVYIKGKWRFIETTWGSGHVDENQKFVRKFSNFYFLTKPEHFIEEHFPYIDNDIETSKQWQLLKIPLSLTQFCEGRRLTPEAHSLGIELPQNKFEVINTERSSDIIITSLNNLDKMSTKLRDSNGQNCENSLITLKENSKTYKITIRPNRTGSYFLDIFGSTEFGEMVHFVAFLIQCTAVEDNWKPYPPDHGFYGVRSDFSSRGFDPKSKVSPFHTCMDGNFNFVIKTEKNPPVIATLYDGKGNRNEGFILQEESDNDIFIRARMLEIGYYTLTIFSEHGKIKSYSHAFDILILNTGKSTIRQPYPQTYHSTNEFKCRLFNPLVRSISPNSTSPIATAVMVNGQVYKKENNDEWNIEIKTGDSGDITLYARTDVASSCTGVYTFQIKS